MSKAKTREAAASSRRSIEERLAAVRQARGDGAAMPGSESAAPDPVGAAAQVDVSVPSGDIPGHLDIEESPDHLAALNKLAETKALATHAVTVEMAQIDADPEQFRKKFDSTKIDSLAESIRRSTLLQPIHLKRQDGRLRIIAGERRYLAVRQLAWRTIPAVIWDQVDPGVVMALRIVENDQREDLTPEERRTAYLALKEQCGGNATLARQILGRSKTHWYRVVNGEDEAGPPAVAKGRSAIRTAQPAEAEPEPRAGVSATPAWWPSTGVRRTGPGQLSQLLRFYAVTKVGKLDAEQRQALLDALDQLREALISGGAPESIEASSADA